MEAKEEKSYLLLVYGNYDGGEKFVKEIVNQFAPVLSSNMMKYTWGENGLVCHFDSNVDFEDLQMFVQDVMGMMCEQYFFMEKPDKMSVHGPQEIIEHLFELENNIDGYVYKNQNLEDPNGMELDKIMEFFMSINDEVESAINDDDEDNEIEIIKKSKKKKPEPNIDDILDKMIDKGKDSLTKKEKKILDNYSNDGK